MKQRKMPLRKCTGCGEMKEKRELIRVVKAPDTKDENGEIIDDVIVMHTVKSLQKAKFRLTSQVARQAGAHMCAEILPVLKRLARHAALNAR